MRQVRLAVIGIGWWSDVLAACIQRSASAQLVGGYTRDAAKRDAFGQKFSCPTQGSLEELLSIPELDGVVVTVPNHAHREIALAAAAAGKHVFLEKPIANTMADGCAIINACDAAGVLLSIGHSYRRHAALRRLRSLIDDGTLGRLTFAEAVFTKDRGFGFTNKQDWRFSKASLPGGCLMQIGLHQIDNLLYLMGPARTVSARFAHLETPAEVDDVTTAIIEFSSGAQAVVMANYVTAERFRISLYGTAAIATFDLETGLSLQMRGEKRGTQIELEVNDYLLEEIDEFATCILSGARPEVSGPEGLAALEIVRAAVDSAASGHVVILDPTEKNANTTSAAAGSI